MPRAMRCSQRASVVLLSRVRRGRLTLAAQPLAGLARTDGGREADVASQCDSLVTRHVPAAPASRAHRPEDMIRLSCINTA